MPDMPLRQEYAQRSSEQNLLGGLGGIAGQGWQNVAGLSYQQGLQPQPLPYPYSNGYPVPGRSPLVPVPEPEVESIASPMDAIVNPKPRKMRIHDEIL